MKVEGGSRAGRSEKIIVKEKYGILPKMDTELVIGKHKLQIIARRRKGYDTIEVFLATGREDTDCRRIKWHI